VLRSFPRFLREWTGHPGVCLSQVVGPTGSGQYTTYMHSPVRLVAIDVDGTLLPGFGKALTPRTGRALKAAQEAGIVVALATGRRTDFAVPLLKGLNLRADMPLIASNGAVLRTLGGDTLDRCLLPAQVARGLCELLRPFGVLVFTFDRPGNRELAIENLAQAREQIAPWVEANREALEVVKPLENAFCRGEDPIQGMIAGGVEAVRRAEVALRASPWGEACTFVKTEYPGRDLSLLDLLPRNVSKAKALEGLTRRLGVKREETMAFGDNWNDVEMLKWAGQGVIMGNAVAELRSMGKKRGWRLAPPNDEDGVAVVLEEAIAQYAAAEN
jgi:HAD superfamily hydrolase (TIGR01484 family)